MEKDRKYDVIFHKKINKLVKKMEYSIKEFNWGFLGTIIFFNNYLSSVS